MMKVIAICMFALVAGILAKPEYPHENYQSHGGPGAPIGHDGRVVDTPEVAKAKAIHFAEYAKAAAKAPYTHDTADEGARHFDGAAYVNQPVLSAYASHPALYSAPIHFDSRIHHTRYYGYDGPPAPLNHEGRVIDTPEVENAKAAHFAEYNRAASRLGVEASAPETAYAHATHNYAEAPLRTIHPHVHAPLAHDGRVVDTPEVAHAKAVHFAAYAKALSQARPAHYGNYLIY